MIRAGRPTARSAAAVVLAALALALSGCLLVPGKFRSSLDIRKDGHFTYTYAGEIHVLALSRLARMAQDADEAFKARPCLGSDSGEERACTAEEAAAQKREWEEERARTADRRKRENEQVKAFLGGIDPDDPRAAEEFAQRLRRQAGWRKVAYKGDGLYDVDVVISGTLGHDFAFPTIERMAANDFVVVSVRADRTVRIDAPGFGPAQGGAPLRGMMEMGAIFGGKQDGASGPRFPAIDGTFTLRTDGTILANNTDEGPRANPAGSLLEWVVTPRSTAAPMALVRLGG